MVEGVHGDSELPLPGLPALPVHPLLDVEAGQGLAGGDLGRGLGRAGDHTLQNRNVKHWTMDNKVSTASEGGCVGCEVLCGVSGILDNHST